MKFKYLILLVCLCIGCDDGFIVESVTGKVEQFDISKGNGFIFKTYNKRIIVYAYPNISEASMPTWNKLEVGQTYNLILKTSNRHNIYYLIGSNIEKLKGN